MGSLFVIIVLDGSFFFSLAEENIDFFPLFLSHSLFLIEKKIPTFFAKREETPPSFSPKIFSFFLSYFPLHLFLCHFPTFFSVTFLD